MPEHLAALLDCENLETASANFDGFQNLARATGRSLGPIARALFMPTPLQATTTAVGYTGPISTKPGSFSPFGIVEEPSNVFINFDFAPDESPVESGTVVNTLYSSQGVTFQKAGTGSLCGPNVYANADQPEGFGSFPNVVSLCAPPIATDISENTFGLIQADFVSSAVEVCIQVTPADNDETHFARLDAFDATGEPLGSASSSPGVTQNLCFTGTGIRRVRFSGAGTKFARFDDLQVNFTAPPID